MSTHLLRRVNLFGHNGREPIIHICKSHKPLSLLIQNYPGRTCSITPASFMCTLIKWNQNTSAKPLRIDIPVGPDISKAFVIPRTETLKHFVNVIEAETKEDVIVKIDGVDVVRSTNMSCLVNSTFDLQIGEQKYTVAPEETENKKSGQDIGTIGYNDSNIDVEQVRILTKQLYSLLDKNGMDVMTLTRANTLAKNINEIQEQLHPMEQALERSSKQAKRYTNKIIWGLLGMMGIQFGALFRMTYWEYSWDVVEPMTYFITYATAIGSYSMFVATQKDADYKTLAERCFLRALYRESTKNGIDLYQFNALKKKLSEMEVELDRIDGKSKIVSGSDITKY